MAIDISFYAVQNSDGKYFRRKGYGGGGNSWVDSIEQARVWAKIAGARTVVSFWANRYPEYPVPRIVKLVVSEIVVIDETERIKASQLKKQQQNEKAKVQLAQRRFELAEKELKEAQAKYDEAKGTL